MKSDLLKVMGMCTMLAMPTTLLASEPEQPTTGGETQALVELAAEEGKDKKGDMKDSDKKSGASDDRAG